MRTLNAGRHSAGPRGPGRLLGMLAAAALVTQVVAAPLPGQTTGAPMATGSPIYVLDLYVPEVAGLQVGASTVELGRTLFFDTRLSADGSLACGSCHLPDRAFAGATTVAIGVGGRRGNRNVPALINRGYGEHFSWDGRGTSLLEQVLLPIENPLELDLPVDTVVARLSRDASLVRRFESEFGQSPSAGTLARALAAYVASITSDDAPFDRHFQGDTLALDREARHGRRLFLGKARCSLCHVGPNLTDERFHVTGVAWRSGRPDDPGRFALTGDSTQLGAFKTPTLREIERTAPYMHDGSIGTLDDVVEFYDEGGIPNPHLDQALRPLGLNATEKRALLAFLRSLSGTVREGS